jgi:hypothetical protein
LKFTFFVDLAKCFASAVLSQMFGISILGDWCGA